MKKASSIRDGDGEVAEHGRIVLPGDQVVHASALSAPSLILFGTGLSEIDRGLVASLSGTVKVLASGKGGAGDVRVWVDANSRRYSPSIQVSNKLHMSPYTHRVID